MFKYLFIIPFLFEVSVAMVSDSLLLAQLLSTTASQLKELTELADQTKDMSDKFNMVGTAIDEKIDFAERLEMQANEIKELQEIYNSEDLEGLTENLKNLKSTVADTKEFIKEVRIEQAKAKKKGKELDHKKRSKDKESKKVDRRILISAKGNNVGSNGKATAVNTALIHKGVKESNGHLVESNQIANDIYKLELARAVRDGRDLEARKSLVEDFEIKKGKQDGK